MESPVKRVNVPGFALSFLTDNVQLGDENPESKAERAEFVQSALRPVKEVNQLVVENCDGIGPELQAEVRSAVQAMKILTDSKCLAADKKLLESQQRLSALEQDIEDCEIVHNLQREIELYSDKVQKMERQLASLQAQKVKYDQALELFSSVIPVENAKLTQVAHENIQLHKALGTGVPKVETPIIRPLLNISNYVPIDVFMQLSSKDVGNLTLTQLRTFLKYKKNVEAKKDQVARLKEEVRIEQLTRFTKREKASLARVFQYCISVFQTSHPMLTRSLSSIRYFPPHLKLHSPTLAYETILSSHLYDIDTSRELFQKRRQTQAIHKDAMKKMRIEDILHLVLSHTDCLERLTYFLTHPHPLKLEVDQTRIDMIGREIETKGGDLQVQDTKRIGR